MTQFPTINLKVNFIKERGQVIAHSPALDISTVGKSEKQARKRFEELLRIFLSDITERKVVNEVLTELGWKKVLIKRKRQWVPPTITSANIKIPQLA